MSIYIPPDSILFTDKPKGFTSRKWDDFVTRRLKIKKSGHVGTLDPMATGLQIILCGKSTKLSDYILETSKEYEGTVRLGITTDTWDAEGQVLNYTRPNSLEVVKNEIEQIVFEFTGNITQKTPPYSAVKVDGKALHYWTRAGIEKTAPDRNVEVMEFSISNFSSSIVDGFDCIDFDFYIKCSPGTYIRSIAHEIGEQIATGAHLCALRRVAIGDFRLDESIKKEDVENENVSSGVFSSYDIMKMLYTDIELSEEEAASIKHGQKPELENNKEHIGLAILSFDNKLWAVADFDINEYKVKRVFG